MAIIKQMTKNQLKKNDNLNNCAWKELVNDIYGIKKKKITELEIKFSI